MLSILASLCRSLLCLHTELKCGPVFGAHVLLQKMKHGMLSMVALLC